ncbi:MAG: HAMP domain-containing histidine kinase [Planctomycetes bacterium]|nr:HAMP domain-containing histidine kinase [Planctomycetota bacterium]
MLNRSSDDEGLAATAGQQSAGQQSAGKQSAGKQSAAKPDATRLDFIERRWRGIQKVINHDLPNQLVAIHGLLQLLAQDESTRLSAEGKEILRRLQGTSARVLETTHSLKLLAKAGDALEMPAVVTLADLASEAAAEVQQSHPSLDVERRFPPDLKVSAGPQALYQAVVLLLKLAVQVAEAPKAGVLVGAAESPAGRELTIGFKQERPTAPATVWSARALEERLETLLAREWLRAAGGELRVGESTSPERLFAITLARPSV